MSENDVKNGVSLSDLRAGIKPKCPYCGEILIPALGSLPIEPNKYMNVVCCKAL